MKRIKFLALLFIAFVALVSCSKEDNPVDPTTVNVDDPQEIVTDQPANARAQ